MRSMITCLGGGVGGGINFSTTVGWVITLGACGGRSLITSGGGVGGAGAIWRITIGGAGGGYNLIDSV